MKPKHTILAVLLLLVFVDSAHADELYTFSFTPISGPVESFSFSFTVSSFLAPGQTIPVTPFEITDGISTWDITTGIVTGANCGLGGFLYFFTQSVSYVSPCGSLSSPPSYAEINIGIIPQLPSTEGDFSKTIVVGDVGPPYTSFGGDLDLSITAAASVPEPNPIPLMSAILLAMAFGALKRIARGRRPLG